MVFKWVWVWRFLGKVSRFSSRDMKLGASVFSYPQPLPWSLLKRIRGRATSFFKHGFLGFAQSNANKKKHFYRVRPIYNTFKYAKCVVNLRSPDCVWHSTLHVVSLSSRGHSLYIFGGIIECNIRSVHEIRVLKNY